MNAKKFLAVLVCAVMLMQCTAFAADIAPEAIPYVRPEIESVAIDQVGEVITVTVTTTDADATQDLPVMVYVYDEDMSGGFDQLLSDFEYSMRAGAYKPVNEGVAELELMLYETEESSYKEFAIDLYHAGETYIVEDYFIAGGRLLNQFLLVFVDPQLAGDETWVFDDTKEFLESPAHELYDEYPIYNAISALANTKDVKLTGKDYEDLADDGKQEFADLLDNAVNGKYSHLRGSEVVADYETLEPYVKEAYILAAYNKGGFTNEKLAEIVYEFDETIGFDANDEDLYGAVEDKEAVVKIAKKIDVEVDSTDELSEALEKAVSVQVVNEAYWLNVVNVIAANNDIFEIDEDEIEKLLDTKKFRTLFCEEFKGTYDSIRDIRDAWDDAYEDAWDEYQDSKSSGGGGGLGGGSREPVVTENTVSTQISTAEKNYDPTVAILDYYTDMAGYHWSCDAVLNLTKGGIVSGYGDKTFKPANSVTRAEFMKMVVNVFGLADITATTTFADVDQNAWYYIYVASAEKYGIAQGYGNGLFGVNDPVTRQDAITIVYRAAQLKGLSLEKFAASTDVFSDKSEIAAYAEPAVAALYHTGVYLDSSDNARADVFAPTKNASRAYLAVILNQIYIYMNK